MTLRLSTGLRDKLLGLQASPVCVFNEAYPTADSITYASTSTIVLTTPTWSFITANVAPGMALYTYDSITPANDVAGEIITGVVADTITCASAPFSAEGWDPTTTGVVCKGGSLKDIFHDGVIRIYSGSAPTTADAAASGTLLVEISVSSGTFAHNEFANGLEFGTAASGAIAKATGETWSGSAAASGTAGYFRLLGNPTDSGALSTTLPRIQGSIGTSGADLNMTSTSITSGATYTIDTFQLTLPAYYGA